MTATEILNKYTAGEATLEETNAALKEAGANFHLNPGKNEIKPGEEANYGLLDTGTGSFDKVEINPETMTMVNCDCGETYALCIYNGKTYKVQGAKLV